MIDYRRPKALNGFSSGLFSYLFIRFVLVTSLASFRKQFFIFLSRNRENCLSSHCINPASFLGKSTRISRKRSITMATKISQWDLLGDPSFFFLRAAAFSAAAGGSAPGPRLRDTVKWFFHGFKSLFLENVFGLSHFGTRPPPRYLPGQ